MSDTSPATFAAAVTPSDSADLPNGRCRALYIGAAGNVAIPGAGGTPVVFVAVQAGTVLPVQTTRVRSTSTTATSIVALY